MMLEVHLGLFVAFDLVSILLLTENITKVTDVLHQTLEKRRGINIISTMDYYTCLTSRNWF